MKARKKKTNPGRKHLAGATAKQQRQYEAIKRSERRRGVPLKEAKRIAAATTRARSKRRNPQYTVEAIPKYATTVKETIGAITRGSAIRKLKKKVPGPKNIYRYRVEKNPRRRNKAGSISESDISKLPERAQAQIRAQLGKVEERERKATTPAQKKAAEKSRRSFLSRLGTRLRVMGQTQKYKVSARDLGRCKRRVIKVRGRHETDALSKAQSKLGRGFDDYKVMNPTASAADSKKWEKLWAAYIKALKAYDAAIPLGRDKWKPARMRLMKAEKAISDFDYDAYERYVVGRKRNPTRKGMRRTYGTIKRISKISGDSEIEMRKGVRHGMQARRRFERKYGYRNPSPAEIRKEFSGGVTGARDLYFPQGTPHGLAKLGKVVSITTEEGTIKPVAGTAWLCSDTKGKLHLGSTNGAPLYDGPRRSFGEVTKLEYEDVKRHLGHVHPTIFFHHVGEENGIRPRLYADGKGGLVFKGGAYRITSRGLEN